MSEISIPADQQEYYAGLWVMKKLDLQPKDGGITLEVPLESQYAFAEPVIDRLTVDGYLSIDEKRGVYAVTDAGRTMTRHIIDEAEGYVTEFDDEETEDMIVQLRRRNIDVFRVRFLWGLYVGELTTWSSTNNGVDSPMSNASGPSLLRLPNSTKISP